MADIVVKAKLIDDISKQLKAISSNAKKTGNDTTRAFDDINESTNRASSGVSNLRKGLGSLGAMVGVGGLAKAFFDASTQVENLEVKFNTLLGGADKAKARVKELREFASKTPFQLDEVANSSKVLQTLGGNALATGEGLRMVGDAAAISGESFENLAVHIGRAYSGLQSNRPIGESMARLQELGLVTGETRNKIEELTKQARGKEAWTILQAELDKTRGGMELLSQTTTGQISTMKDLAKQMMVNLGDTNFLKVAISRMNTFLQVTNETLEANQNLNELMNKEKHAQLKQTIAFLQKLSVQEELGANITQSLAIKREKGYKKVKELAEELGLSEKQVGKLVQESRLKQIALNKQITWLTEEQITKLEEMDYLSQKELDDLDKKISKTAKLAGKKKEASDIDVTAQKKVKDSDLMLGFDEGFADQRRERAEAWQEMLDNNLKKKLEANQKEQDEETKRLERIKMQREEESRVREQAQDNDTKIAERGARDRERIAEQEFLARYNLAFALNSSLSTIATNALGNSKKNAKLRKGIAYGEAVINTALGVSKALATGVFPVNMLNAAAVSAAGAAQISTIATQKFATGGIVKGRSGESQVGDKQVVRVNAGEGVFTKEQMKAMGKTEINMPITINGNADERAVTRFSEIAQEIIGAIRNGDLDLINELNLQTA